MTERVAALFAWIAFAVGIWIALSTIKMVIAAWNPAPYWDQWEQLVSGREASWSWLVSQHNEHRILFPRLVFMADRWLFNETHVFDTALIVVCLCALVVVLVLLATAERQGSSSRVAWITGVSLALLFWAVQVDNFISGFEVSWFLVMLASASAFAALALLAPTPWALALVLVLETIAVYSMADGILVPFLVAPMALLLRRPPSHVIVLALAAVALLGSYLVGYRTPPHHADPAVAWQHVGTMLSYVLAEAGAPFGAAVQTLAGPRRSLDAAIVLGGMAALFLVVVSWQMVRRPADRTRGDLAVLMLAWFMLGTTLLTALGRADRFGIRQALDSRYATVGLLFWVCVGLLAASRIRSEKDGRWLALTASALPLLGIVLVCQRVFVHEAEHQARERRSPIPALLSNVADAALLERIYPNVPRELYLTSQLKKAHGSIFADEWGHWLGTPMTAHTTLSSPQTCAGEFDLAQEVTTAGWRAYGRAWDSSLRQPVKRIVLADPGGNIVGFGINGAKPDTVPSPAAVGPDAWMGNFGGSADQIRAYALVGSDRSACLLGDPQRVEHLPELNILHGPLPPASPGGIVDAVAIGERTVIIGWAMLSPMRTGQRLDVETNLPVASFVFSRLPRPDVAEVLGDERLSISGVKIELELKPGTAVPSGVRLCISSSDPEYGDHMLSIPSRPDLCQPRGA